MNQHQVLLNIVGFVCSGIAQFFYSVLNAQEMNKDDRYKMAFRTIFWPATIIEIFVMGLIAVIKSWGSK